MDLNLQPTSFTKYLLELCNIKVNSLKNFIIPQKELENFCHCLKNILKFVDYWKDNIQQSVDQGKLRTFKRLKIIFEFEKYISEIGNIKHRQANTKLRISAHRLPVETAPCQVDIAMYLFTRSALWVVDMSHSMSSCGKTIQKLNHFSGTTEAILF
jgi:hypothetical protein